MKKILLGILIGLGLTTLVVKAAYIQTLADTVLVATLPQYSVPDGAIYRFEWYGDVCYVVRETNSISCIKE